VAAVLGSWFATRILAAQADLQQLQVFVAHGHALKHMLSAARSMTNPANAGAGTASLMPGVKCFIGVTAVVLAKPQAASWLVSPFGLRAHVWLVQDSSNVPLGHEVLSLPLHPSASSSRLDQLRSSFHVDPVTVRLSHPLVEAVTSVICAFVRASARAQSLYAEEPQLQLQVLDTQSDGDAGDARVVSRYPRFLAPGVEVVCAHVLLALVDELSPSAVG